MDRWITLTKEAIEEINDKKQRMEELMQTTKQLKLES